METIDKITKGKREKRTLNQNSALHLWFTQLSEVLNENGMDMRKTMNIPLKPTPILIKEAVFKPIMKEMFGKESTTQLLKQKEIDDVYDVINKMFAEMGISVPPFPSIDI